MTSNGYDAYKTVATTTADPVTLTTMLFEAGVKALKKARLHFESGNRPGFLKETERAYLIVGELFATLDLSQGELPQRLSGIYTYCMRCIVEATLGDVSKLDEAGKHMAAIGNAWKTAMADYSAGDAPPASQAAA